MPWSSVKINYGPTGYTQQYKRRIDKHSEDLQGSFIRAALTDSLTLINANLPHGFVPTPVPLSDLSLVKPKQGLPNDPGPTYRAI